MIDTNCILRKERGELWLGSDLDDQILIQTSILIQRTQIEIRDIMPIIKELSLFDPFTKSNSQVMQKFIYLGIDISKKV